MNIGDRIEFHMIREHSPQWRVMFDGHEVATVTQGWLWKEQEKYTVILRNGCTLEFTNRDAVVNALVSYLKDAGFVPVKCERPGCKRWAKYDAPGHWCGKHWKMWWYYGTKGKKDPRWVTHRADGSERFSKSWYLCVMTTECLTPGKYHPRCQCQSCKKHRKLKKLKGDKNTRSPALLP